MSINTIEKLTKMTNKSQNQKLRLFAKVDIITKLKIMQQQKQIFHKLKNLHSDLDNAVLTLSSFIISINLIIKSTNTLNLNAIKLRGKNIKNSTKREKLLGYWAIVKALKKEQGMSFREISKYFKKYHKFEVSYSLIFEIWDQIENKNTKKGEENG